MPAYGSGLSFVDADNAVLVVVARRAGRDDAQHAGRVKLTRVPSESAGESRQLDRGESAGQAAPIERKSQEFISEWDTSTTDRFLGAA